MDTTTPRRLKIRVDLNKCVGSTMCIQFAPTVFGLGPSRQSEVIDSTGDTVARIREAAEQCPLCAIELIDADTGETVFP